MAMNKMKQMQVTRVSSTPQTTRKAVPKCSNTELVSQKLRIKLRLCNKILKRVTEPTSLQLHQSKSNATHISSKVKEWA